MKLILGQAKTGKTKYIFDKIDEDKKKGKEVIYFVPSQMRSLSEENYINFQNKPGIIDINITTISSYIKDFLNEYKSYNKDKYISKLDRKLILSKVLANNSSIFKIFSKVKNKDGFIQNLNIYMDILKKEDIQKDDIKNINIDDKLIECKLKEISEIYEKYSEYTKNLYIDDIDENNIFLSAFEEKYKLKDISNINIYFDSYNNFTNQEFKFIKLLMKLKFNISFAITTNINSKLEEININNISNLLLSECDNIYTIPNNTILSLLKYSNKLDVNLEIEKLNCNYSNSPKDIKFLSNNIFLNSNIKKIKPQNISINLWTNAYTEIQNIAIDISKKIRQGDRYNDFAIYTSCIDEYSYVISKVFYEYNIPVYLDSKILLSDNILIKYMLRFLEILKFSYKRESLFELLKYGLNTVTFEEISYLENYCIEFNIDRYKFEKKFIYNNKNNGTIYDLDKLNEIRISVINIFEDSKLYFKEKHTAFETINNIYTNLNESGVLENYTFVINEMKENDNPNVKYLGNVGNQAWDSICSIFNSIDKIYMDLNMDITEFEKVFKYSLSDISFKSIPPTIDELQVLDVNSSKSSPKKYIYFIGVNEDKLPKKIDDDILFDDSQLEKLNVFNIKFKETSFSKVNMQLYNISEHLKEAEYSLNFSFVSSDLSGKSLRPSSLIDSIKDILEIDIVGNVTKGTQDNEIYSKKDALEKLINLLNNEESITDEILVLYKYISENGYFNEIIKYSRMDNSLNEQTISKLIGNKFTTSVSKLELFKKCPFSYFLKYGLGLNERKTFNITSLDTGDFMHNILEKFSKYLFENDIAWHVILIEKDKFSKILDNIIEDELNSTFIKHKENIKFAILKQKLKSTMNKVVFTIAQSFNQSKFTAYGYEIEFKEGSLFSPIEITLDNGSIMYIIGKIDRIDTMKLNDITYARIVDYKSSNRELKLSDIKEGLSLQLITYLSSFIENISDCEVIPAGMMYFTLSEKLINFKSYTSDEKKITKAIIESLRMKGIFLKDIQILNLMDNKLNEDSRLIDISSKTLNSDKKSEKLLSKEEFKELCQEVKGTLKNIANDILSGNVSISPDKRANHCQYCQFSNICRKNNMC